MHRRALLIGVTALAAEAAAQEPEAAPALPPHLDTLRPLALTMPDGAPTTLDEHLLPNRPSIVQFWATWCSPCIEEGRHLAGVRSRTPLDQLNIVGVNIDRESVRESERLQTFMRRSRMNYVQLNGSVAAYRAFGNSTVNNQLALPRLYLFYADGRPVTAFGRYDGRRTLAQLDQAIARALSGPA